jgi:hypothetical protein
MNKDMMKRNVGAHVLLVPPACHLDRNDLEIPPRVEDDFWIVESVNDEGVRISDPRTAHARVLAYDHVYDFTSDQPQNSTRRGFLTLKVQMYVQGNEVRIVPNVRPGEPVVPKRPEIIEKTVEITYPSAIGDSKSRGPEQSVLHDWWTAKDTKSSWSPMRGGPYVRSEPTTVWCS